MDLCVWMLGDWTSCSIFSYLITTPHHMMTHLLGEDSLTPQWSTGRLVIAVYVSVIEMDGSVCVDAGR